MSVVPRNAMHRDPVERQVRKLIGRIPAVMETRNTPMTIRQIASALDYYTNAPWCVVFAVQRLERHGVLARDVTSKRRSPWRWRLTSRQKGA